MQASKAYLYNAWNKQNFAKRLAILKVLIVRFHNFKYSFFPLYESRVRDMSCGKRLAISTFIFCDSQIIYFVIVWS